MNLISQHIQEERKKLGELLDKLLELDEIMKSYRRRSGELMEMYYWVKDGYKETEIKEDVLAMIYERAQIYTKESEKAFKKLFALKDKYEKDMQTV